MSDHCLELVSSMIQIVEPISRVPLQLQIAQVILLMGPRGGYRPIGLFCSLRRLRGRCRRGYAQQWEVFFAGPYFARQAFSGAADVVWRQMARPNAANSREEVSATLLRGTTKFYENVSLGRLGAHCAKFQFPPALYKLSPSACRSARFMGMGIWWRALFPFGG
eukprot:9236768-Pyramimonas_sp.AAC.1